jgi:hypothetical protein
MKVGRDQREKMMGSNHGRQALVGTDLIHVFQQLGFQLHPLVRTPGATNGTDHMHPRLCTARGKTEEESMEQAGQRDTAGSEVPTVATKNHHNNSDDATRVVLTTYAETEESFEWRCSRIEQKIQEDHPTQLMRNP